ncbi:MAG: hypothetical protein KGJ90_02115 [Patescibacteria group bacterium]|nr:hypothetical protein [Patescibacteria group bacterium]
MVLFDFTPLPRDENYVALQNTYRNIASGNGTVTTSGTAVQVTATPTQAKIIDIINPAGNADVIVIGDKNVKYSPLKGIPIEPGFSYRINVTDLSNLWVDAAGNGYTFSYNYYW